MYFPIAASIYQAKTTAMPSRSAHSVGVALVVAMPLAALSSYFYCIIHRIANHKRYCLLY